MIPNSGCENPELVGSCQLQTLQQVTGIRSDMECLVILDPGWVFTLNVMRSIWCSQYSRPAAHGEGIWFSILLHHSLRKSCIAAFILNFLHHVTCAVANLHCIKMQLARSIQYIWTNKTIFLQLALSKGACPASSSITFHDSLGSGRKSKRKSPMAILIS